MNWDADLITRIAIISVVANWGLAALFLFTHWCLKKAGFWGPE